MAVPPILVVEDDAAIRTILCELLTDEGIPVVAVESLAEARHHLATTEVSGVILEHIVDDGTADFLLDELKGSSTPPPVVLVSGDPAAVAIANQYGVAFKRKPFDADDLLAAVEAMHEGKGCPPRP